MVDMANPVAKIKDLVARLVAMVKRPKGVERPAKKDPIQTQLRVFLWVMLVLMWGLMGKVTYEIFGNHGAPGLEDPHASLIEKIKEKALYPWAKGFSRGHDIVESEVQEDRGLAAALGKKDLKVSMGARYIEFRDVEATVKAGMGNYSKMLLAITFEVDNYPAEQEVLKKEMKIREVVAAVLSTKDKDVLRDYRRVAAFKKELMDKMKLVIVTGQVTDVLVTDSTSS